MTGFYRTCVIDGLLEHSPAEHVRHPSLPAGSPTLGFTYLQFEALLTAARESAHPCDFALVAILGLLGLRIFEAAGAGISDLGEEHGHRVLRVCGKGTKVVLVPLPPAVGRAIDTAIGARASGPILLNSRGARMDRHAATRRLRRLADAAGVRISRPHPHMLRHTFVTTMLDAGAQARETPGIADERELPSACLCVGRNSHAKDACDGTALPQINHAGHNGSARSAAGRLCRLLDTDHAITGTRGSRQQDSYLGPVSQSGCAVRT